MVSRSLTSGRTAGLATVAGNAAGEYLLVVAVAVGIGAIVSSSIAIFTVVKLAGAAYLVYLGIQAIRHRRGLGEIVSAPAVVRTTRRHVGDAFVVGVGQPQVDGVLRRHPAAVRRQIGGARCHFSCSS